MSGLLLRMAKSLTTGISFCVNNFKYYIDVVSKISFLKRIFKKII